MADFDLSGNQNPWTDFDETCKILKCFRPTAIGLTTTA